MKNEVLRTIDNRRSTRGYKEEQINEEELQILLDAAIQAPSAMNSQPWYFTVVQDKKMIDLMNEKSKELMAKDENPYVSKVGKGNGHIFHKAPTVIIVSGKKDVSSSLVDCSAAIENMLLAGESIGLGSVWIGFARHFFQFEDEVKKLNIPEGYEPYYAVSIGYKKNESEKGPGERNRDVVNYIRE